jgi:uncharacterized damage-inducible protein DinB
MLPTMSDRFRKWYEHERDAHAKVIRSLETVLAHLAMARRVWLERLGIIPAATGSLFPDKNKLAETVTQLETVEQLWSDYLGKISDEELARFVEYTSFDAGRCRSRLEDILTQLFTHSAYHRGQIALLVRAAGGEPAATDYIYWCREPVKQS